MFLLLTGNKWDIDHADYWYWRMIFFRLFLAVVDILPRQVGQPNRI